MNTATRCRIHDCIIDEFDGCDFCRADAAEDCPTCDGTGVIETRHPRWGCPDCPDDLIETDCRTCGGTGMKP